MIHKVWRLSENSGDDNLGLACTEQGLMLGRTLLIERRDGRFVVRERSEIECLFSLAYGREATAQRLMSGLATVASALNADDQAFVIAFVRHHGSLKKMESIFGISYPTVKNRLNAIGAALDRNFESPSPNLYVLEQLSRGELTVEEALDKLS